MPRRLRSSIGAFAAADRRRTVLVIVLGMLAGLLVPAFAVATGALVGAVDRDGAVGLAIVAVVSIFLVARVIDPWQENLGQTLWRAVDESLTVRVMRAVLAPPGLATVESPKVQDRLLQAQGVLTDLTPGQAAHRLGWLVALAVQGIGSLALVASFSPVAALVLAVGYALAFRVYGSHWHHVTLVLHGRTDRLRHAYYLRALALDPVAAKETRVFGLADWLVDGYRRRWTAEMVEIWKARREGWALSLGTIGALAAAEGFVVWSVIDAALAGTVSPGRAVVLVQAVLGAAVLGTYNEAHWLMAECGRAIERIREVESEGSAASGRGALGSSISGDGAPLDTAPGAPLRSIRFEDVGFTHPGRSTPVYEHLELEIEAGRSLAIVGENGAGKTTLVKLLCRLYDPTSGRITVDGVDLATIDPDSWHHRLAAVFQDFVQFELTARDNVAYGSLAHRDDLAAVRDAVALAGAGDFIERLAGGWDTPLSRAFSDGTQLSGGQWQRLALARALFAVRHGAGVLILDEPTAALDARGEAEVYERFLDLTRGATTVVISHRFSTVRRADRIVVLEHGQVVEDGTHESLVAAGGRYAEMYRLQASRFDGPESTTEPTDSTEAASR